jgi:hypothetical protein
MEWKPSNVRLLYLLIAGPALFSMDALAQPCCAFNGYNVGGGLGFFNLSSAISANAYQNGMQNYSNGNVNGTGVKGNFFVGYSFTPNDWLYLGAELGVNIVSRKQVSYTFQSGHIEQWMQQGALGATYQYLMHSNYVDSLEVNVYGAHAPSKSLNPAYGSYANYQITTPYVVNRHIAGSTAGGASGGVNFNLWTGGLLGLDLNWDDVIYNRLYYTDKHADGFGGTIHFEQRLSDHARLFLLAAPRKPYSNYQGALNFDNLNFYGRWSAGIFGAYTSGKERLINSYNIGLNFNYFADVFDAVPNLKGEADYKHEAVGTVVRNPAFLNWVSDPAVYMPQVLAQAEQTIQATCAAGTVTATGILPDKVVFFGNILVIDLAQYFAGNDLTYTVNHTPTTTVGDTIAVIPGTSLLIIGASINRTVYTLTVTARNACGQATTVPSTLYINF